MCVHSKSINSEANIRDAISQQEISVEGMPECKYFEMEDISKFNPENYDMKLLHLNIQSLLNRQGLLIKLPTDLRRNKLNIDVLMLCETYLNSSIAKLLKILGYNLAYRNRLNKKNAGVTILIKDHLKFKEQDYLLVFQEGECESVFVELEFHKGPGVVVGSVYRISRTM